MKLVVTKDDILAGLAKVQSIIGTRTTLPVLHNVYLKAEKDRLLLQTTDLEVTVRTSVPAKVSRSGGTTIPAKRVFGIFRELPISDIEIDTDEKDISTIRSGNSVFKIIGMSEDEFPPIAKVQGGKSFTMDQGVFKRMLACTSYAASEDESRYILNGVLLSFKDDKLTVVATDGRRMAMDQQDVEFLKESEGDWVIPSKTVNELLRTLKDEGVLKIQATDNNAVFEFEEMLLVTKLLDGTYPNYRQVIPEQPNAEMILLPREEFMTAVRRIALLASDKSSSITIAFGKDKAAITSQAPEIGEASESVAIKYRGREITIAFNPDFLLDPFRTLAEDELNIYLTDELSAAVIKCNSPHFQYVLMPMRVK